MKVFTHYISCSLCTLTLTLCIIASWSRDGVVFFVSSHLVTSSRLPCPSSTNAHWPQLGAPVPPPPKWHPLPQGPRTLPFQGPEQVQSLLEIQSFWGLVLLWLDMLLRVPPCLMGRGGNKQLFYVCNQNSAKWRKDFRIWISILKKCCSTTTYPPWSNWLWKSSWKKVAEHQLRTFKIGCKEGAKSGSDIIFGSGSGSTEANNFRSQRIRIQIQPRGMEANFWRSATEYPQLYFSLHSRNQSVCPQYCRIAEMPTKNAHAHLCSWDTSVWTGDESCPGQISTFMEALSGFPPRTWTQKMQSIQITG